MYIVIITNYIFGDDHYIRSNIFGGIGNYPKYDEFPTGVLSHTWIDGRVYCLSIINPYCGFEDPLEMMIYIKSMMEKKRVLLIKKRVCERKTASRCLENKTSKYNIRRILRYI